MDLINNRTRDIAAMALDGLYERSKAISANTANALTPGYNRKEVMFEKSLQDVIKREDEKEEMRLQNAKMYQDAKSLLKGQTPERIAFLSSPTNEGFVIDTQDDLSDPIDTDGNNVNIETEMMDEAKNGLQYQVISRLLSNSYSQLRQIISGQNS